MVIFFQWEIKHYAINQLQLAIHLRIHLCIVKKSILHPFQPFALILSIMNSGEIAGLRVNFIVYLQAKWECREYLFQCIFLHACDKSKTSLVCRAEDQTSYNVIFRKIKEMLKIVSYMVITVRIILFIQ